MVVVRCKMFVGPVGVGVSSRSLGKDLWHPSSRAAGRDLLYCVYSVIYSCLYIEL